MLPGAGAVHRINSGLMGRSTDAREPEVLAATFLLRLLSLVEELSG